MLGTILLIILILALVGSVPWGGRTWGYGYGWYPPVGLIVLIVLLIFLFPGLR